MTDPEGRSQTAAMLLDQQARLLDLIGSGAPPASVLGNLVEAIESLLEDARCSIMVFDHESQSLRHSAASRLPAAYCLAIDGMSIGPNAGSCGTAAFHGTSVVVSDTLVDKRWEQFRDLAERYGLRACWSTPIYSSERSLLGTLATYRNYPSTPDTKEIELVAQFSGLIAVALRHAELTRKLIESEELFRRSFEGSAAGMALIADDGLIVRANNAFGDLAAGEPDGVVGRRFVDLIHADDQRIWLAAVDSLISDQASAVEVALRFRYRPGGAARSLGVVSVLPGSIPHGPRLCVNLVDVTRHQRLEAERRARLAAETAQSSAEAANLAKGQFLAAMSHELRTPLTSIVGYSELLSAQVLPPERRLAAVATISAAASHLIAILDDVLDIAKIEAGAVEVEIGPVAIGEAMAEVAQLLGPLVLSRDVQLHIDRTAAVVANADQRRLRQALINVVDNAIKYNRAGGEVRLSSYCREGKVVIEIADNGYGIPPTLRDRLFMPFTHVDNGTNDAEGSGLGLAISRQLVASMGGQITVTDNAAGGTTVLISLPAATQAPLVDLSAVAVDSAFEIDEAGVCRRILERQDLRAPEPSDSVLAVDPVVEVGESGPHQ